MRTKYLRKLLYAFILVAPTFISIKSQQIRGFSEEKEGVVKEVSVIDSRTIHIRTYPKGQPQRKSLVVNDTISVYTDYQIQEETGMIRLETPILRVEYDRQTGNLSFRQ